MPSEKEKDEVIAKIQAAVDAFNPGSPKRVVIIRYNDFDTGEQVIHGYAYRDLKQAQRVATELERDRVAKFGAQVSFVTIL